MLSTHLYTFILIEMEMNRTNMHIIVSIKNLETLYIQNRQDIDWKSQAEREMKLLCTKRRHAIQFIYHILSTRNMPYGRKCWCPYYSLDFMNDIPHNHFLKYNKISDMEYDRSKKINILLTKRSILLVLNT